MILIWLLIKSVDISMWGEVYFLIAYLYLVAYRMELETPYLIKINT